MTLFHGRVSTTYRYDIIKTMSYIYKENKKYQMLENQQEGGNSFMEVMADLNFDQDQDFQLPDLSQLSQMTPNYRNTFDQESLNFDQPIEAEVPRAQNSLLEELGQELNNVNPAYEDFGYDAPDHDFDNPIKVEAGGYDDYNNVEVQIRRNPEDFRTPTDIFQRAANKLRTVDSNLKMYNMKQDLKGTSYRTHSEYFGPERIAAKERMPRLKKILDAKNKTSKKEVVRPTSIFDFTIPEEDTFTPEYFNSLMGDKKKSRVRIVENEDVNLIDQKWVLPPEEVLALDSFNSLFTRDIKQFDIEKELAVKTEGGAAPAASEEAANLHRQSVDFEAGGGPEILGDAGDYGADYNDFGNDNFDAGQGSGGNFNEEGRRKSGPADMTGMNLLNNYFNIKEDDKILSLERKLAQNSNFKITDFKKHINEKYIDILDKLRKVSISYNRINFQGKYLG